MKKLLYRLAFFGGLYVGCLWFSEWNFKVSLIIYALMLLYISIFIRFDPSNLTESERSAFLLGISIGQDDNK